jgi:transcriptional regulator NrdR family protein
MGKPLKKTRDAAPHVGLRCWKCHHRRFRVIYTRAAHDGTIIRRRECCQCHTRITTWERMIGV